MLFPQPLQKLSGASVRSSKQMAQCTSESSGAGTCLCFLCRLGGCKVTISSTSSGPVRLCRAREEEEEEGIRVGEISLINVISDEKDEDRLEFEDRLEDDEDDEDDKDEFR